MFKKLAAVTAVVLGSVAAPVLVAQTAAAAPTDTGKFRSLRAETQKMVCVATEAEMPQARALAAGTTTARGDVTPMAVVIVGKLYGNANYDESAGYLEVQSNALCASSRTDVNVSLGTLGSWTTGSRLSKPSRTVVPSCSRTTTTVGRPTPAPASTFRAATSGSP